MPSDRRPALRRAAAFALVLALAGLPAAASRAAVAAPPPARADARIAPAAADTALADTASAARADSARADSAAAAAAAPPDRVAEVRASFSPESRAYARTRQALALLEPLYGLLAALFVLFSGLSARIRDFAHAFGRRRYVRVLVYLTAYSILGFALAFPLEWYRGFALEHQYGLSNERFGHWMSDQLKGLGSSIAVLGLVPIVALAYAAIEKSPRRWWLWLAGGTAPLMVAGALLQPLVFEPLFNRFTPLADRALSERILALAARADIPARRVFEMDASVQTKKLNAYVSGFGASQRIVIYDNMLATLRPDEILFVVGHEMGHYKLGHIWQGIVVTTAGSAAFFFVTWWVANRAARRFGPRWGFRELHDVASLPLLAVTLSLLAFAAQPLAFAWSRHIEREADAFGLEVTRTPDAAARAFIALGAGNRSDPEPRAAIKWLLYTHPPLVERVRFTQTYRPWERGEPNRYFRGAPADAR
uniref:M48 family peptidase n=1 Tax=Eiseniibacteriota bacterium TaxID=2212470 RepID=A0A832MLU1_UNCEI